MTDPCADLRAERDHYRRRCDALSMVLFMVSVAIVSFAIGLLGAIT